MVLPVGPSGATKKDTYRIFFEVTIFQQRQAKAVGPLKPVIIIEPFEQWGLDIIGEIKPNSSLQHKYILIATDYFTRWVEAIPLCKINESVVMDFLQDHIMTRFGVPISLVFDNATYFSVTERNSYGLGYHNRQLDSRNQSFPICNRN